LVVFIFNNLKSWSGFLGLEFYGREWPDS